MLWVRLLLVHVVGFASPPEEAESFFWLVVVVVLLLLLLLAAIMGSRDGADLDQSTFFS